MRIPMRLTTVRNKSFVNLTDGTGSMFDLGVQSGKLKALFRIFTEWEVNLDTGSMFDLGVQSGKLKALSHCRQ